MANNIYESGMTPVNKTAGRVISKGSEYEPKLKPGGAPEQRTPYPVRALCEIPMNLRHLLGVHFGRLTVMGFSVLPSRWSVRCDCGTYSLRSTKAIRNPENKNDACRACRAKMHMMRREHWLRTGKDSDLEDIPGASRERAPLPPPVTSGPTYRSRQPVRPESPPKKDVPRHWTQEQRDIPTALSVAFGAAKAGKR